MDKKIFFLLSVILSCISSNAGFVQTGASLDSSNWMRDNIGTLGERTLKKICIPGAHDAGMSVYQKGTVLADPCNVLTQSVPIRDQLKFGARYFDIRPALDKGVYYTGHYTTLPGGKRLGGDGQPMKSVAEDISQFISVHNELVIVRLAKSVNMDQSRRFDKQDWENLFQILDKTKNLYIANGNIHLPAITLNEFTNKGTKGAVIYVINEEGLELGSRLGNGFFYFSSLDPAGKYSNTNSLDKMMKDQISKLKKLSKNSYFLLAWTLTQGPSDALLCKLGGAKSIRELAAIANKRLWDVVEKVNKDAFPNILYLDEIKDTNAINVVMEINKRVDLPSGASTLYKNHQFLFVILFFYLFKYLFMK